MCEASFVRQQLRVRYGITRSYKQSSMCQYQYKFQAKGYDIALMRIKDCECWLVERINLKTNEFVRLQLKSFDEVISKLDKWVGIKNQPVDENLKIIYLKNKKLFNSLKGTYDEFISGLANANFSLLEFLKEDEKQVLYQLTMKGE